MNAPVINDDELEGLSDEERAALEDEEETGTENTDDDDLDDDSGQEASTDGGDSNEDQSENSEDGDDKGATEEPGDDAGDGNADDHDTHNAALVQDEFTPQYKAEPVENFKEKMQEFTDRKAELRNQYKDGEFAELEDYEAERDKVEDEIRLLNNAQLKSEISQEGIDQTPADRWQWEQDRFFGEDENKIFIDDPAIGGAFDATVKSLAADEGNSTKSMAWFLTEARRITTDMFKVPGADDGKEKGKNRPGKPDLSKLPPNIGDLPAADQADTGGDEFAHLDKLDGMELEGALARMSDAEQDRYLRG